MAQIPGTDGNDDLVGTISDDQFTVTTGNDTLDGLDGNDILFSHNFDFIEVDLGAGTVVFDRFTQSLHSIETVHIYGANARLTGTDGDDNLIVTGANATISGGAVNDTLSSQDGGGVLLGGAGNDRMWMSGQGAMTVSGGTGDDQLDINSYLSETTISPMACA